MVDLADIKLREWLRTRPSPVVSRREALALGYTDRMIRRRLEAGWWTQLVAGVYDTSASPDSWLATLTGAVSKLPAVVSHHSAAELHAFPGTPRGKLIVTVPHRTTHSYPGVDVRQSTDLTPDYITEVEGLPTTDPERTFLDIAHGHKQVYLTNLLEQLIVSGIIDPERLDETIRQLGRRGRPGTVRARTAAERVMIPLVEELESELERIVLQLIREAGLPLPELQYPLPWRSLRPGRVDMAYVAARLIIECDGRRWHIAAKTFEDDRRRDNLATAAGWRVIRITWKMATEQPHEVVAMIRQALALTA